MNKRLFMFMRSLIIKREIFTISNNASSIDGQLSPASVNAIFLNTVLEINYFFQADFRGDAYYCWPSLLFGRLRRDKVFRSFYKTASIILTLDFIILHRQNFYDGFTKITHIIIFNLCINIKQSLESPIFYNLAFGRWIICRSGEDPERSYIKISRCK